MTSGRPVACRQSLCYHQLDKYVEKVLVCLDGSPLAEEVLPYIAAERCIGKVILVKVLAPPEFNLPIGIPGETLAPVSTGARLDRFQKDLEEAPVYLEAKAQPLREGGLDVETVVLQGTPSQAIIEYARDNGAPSSPSALTATPASAISPSAAPRSTS